MLSLLFASLTTVAAVSSQGAEPSRVSASFQAGSGSIDGRGALYLRPRIGYDGTLADLVLSSPLTLTLGGRATEDFGGAEAWASIVERAAASVGGWQAELGPLVALDSGLAVRLLASRLDPTARRSGARVRGSIGALELGAFVDGLTDVRVAGASSSVELANPLGPAFLSLHGAMDPQAPSRLGPAALGVVEVGGTQRFRIAQGFDLDFALHGALQGRPVGSSRDLALGGALRLGGARSSLLVRCDAHLASENFIVGYFDHVYALERVQAQSWGGGAKADRRAPAGIVVDGEAKLELSSLEVGINYVHRPGANRGRLVGRAAVKGDAWQLSGTLAQRVLQDARDWLEIDAQSYALIDGAVAVRGGLFAFAYLNHRWSEDSAVPLTEGVLGVGYARSWLR